MWDYLKRKKYEKKNCKLAQCGEEGRSVEVIPGEWYFISEIHHDRSYPRLDKPVVFTNRVIHGLSKFILQAEPVLNCGEEEIR